MSFCPERVIIGTDVVEGDIIIAANGKEMESADVLLDIIENAKPGDKVELKIAHVNQDYTVEKFNVTVALLEDTGTTETVTEKSSGSEFENPFAE